MAATKTRPEIEQIIRDLRGTDSVKISQAITKLDAMGARADAALSAMKANKATAESQDGEEIEIDESQDWCSILRCYYTTLGNKDIATSVRNAFEDQLRRLAAFVNTL